MCCPAAPDRMLRQSALELGATVERLSQDDARVRNWYEGLESLVEKAKAGQITEALAELPAHGSSFTYGYLEGPPRLEAAYARFWGILAFGEWEVNRKLEKRMLVSSVITGGTATKLMLLPIQIAFVTACYIATRLDI